MTAKWTVPTEVTAALATARPDFLLTLAVAVLNGTRVLTPAEIAGVIGILAGRVEREASINADVQEIRRLGKVLEDTAKGLDKASDTIATLTRHMGGEG